MKASIDGKGVEIRAESPEESEIIRQLWLQGPCAVAFTRHPDSWDIVIEPRPEIEESHGP
jgi:hypothetical protein